MPHQPDDPGVDEPSRQPSPWQRNATLVGVALSIASVVFAAGVSWQRMNDMSEKLGGMSRKLDQVETIARSAEQQLAEISGVLGVQRHAQGTPPRLFQP